MKKMEDMENRNNHKNQKTVKTDKTASANFVGKESNESTVRYRVKSRIPSFLFRYSLDSHLSRFSLASLICLCMLTVGVGNVWGTTATFSITGKSGSSSPYTITGTLSGAPTGATASCESTYNHENQMTEENSQTLTLKSFGAVLITNITLSMKSNKSSGAGKLRYSTDGGSTWTYIVGSEDAGVNFNNAAWYGSWNNSDYVNVSKNVAIVTEEGKDLIIKIEATANSLFCQSYSITYTTDKFTVAYNRGSGTCGTPSQTQARTGEALTLPNAVPPIDCGERGWEFAGWKKGSAQASTTSAPTLLTGTYIPLSNETLYAVYKVTDGVTTYNSNPNCTYDYYYDIMHGNEIEEIQGVYTVPAALSDAEPGESFCGEKHHHFIGWLEEEYINEDGSLKDGAMSHIVPAGETGHTAANKKFYAIWSKIE